MSGALDALREVVRLVGTFRCANPRDHQGDQLARLCYGDRQQPRAGFVEGRFESKLQAGFFA